MLSWLNHLYRHDIGVTEIPPYPVHAVSWRSCCYLTAPSPPAVWHLQEGKWVHYLIAISTSAQFICLHANSKQESPPRYIERQITFICTCFEILTNRSLPLCFVFMLFFFSFLCLYMSRFHGLPSHKKMKKNVKKYFCTGHFTKWPPQVSHYMFKHNIR